MAKPGFAVAVPARPAREWYATSWSDRAFLFLIASFGPLEDQIPTLLGRSVMWVLFFALLGYSLLFRLRFFWALLSQRLFLACYLFLFVGAAIEAFHPRPDFEVVWRLAEMVLGGIAIASLCRDLRGLRAAILGYFGAGLFLSVWLFVNDYELLRRVEVTTFQKANEIREKAFEDKSLKGNLNTMAFYCAEGALAALALTWAARRTLPRLVLAAGGLVCLVGSFLPLSRSGVICAVAGCAAFLWMERRLNARWLLLTLFLGLGVYLLTPKVSFVRAKTLSLHTRYESGKPEARAGLYEATIRNLPEFFWTGIGCGNFYDEWALTHGFVPNQRAIHGTHNSFFEITVYWGVLGLLTLLLVVWEALRSVPFGRPVSPWAAFILGLFVCLFLRMLSSHNLYAKEFSLGFGVMAGAAFWIWPQFPKGSAQRFSPILATLPPA